MFPVKPPLNPVLGMGGMLTEAGGIPKPWGPWLKGGLMGWLDIDGGGTPPSPLTPPTGAGLYPACKLRPVGILGGCLFPGAPMLKSAGLLRLFLGAPIFR